MKKRSIILTLLLLTAVIAACGNTERADIIPTDPDDSLEQSISESEEASTNRNGHSAEQADTETITETESVINTNESAEGADQEEVGDMIMAIGDTKIQVAWENNESVEALKELVSQEPLSIQMSMYGGFEQVGSIGQNLPRSDEQITTKAGDIVLYSGNQIVVFYGSNSWAYTRLGHISDKNEKELTELLGNGDVTITIE